MRKKKKKENNTFLSVDHITFPSARNNIVPVDFFWNGMPVTGPKEQPSWEWAEIDGFCPDPSSMKAS